MKPIRVLVLSPIPKEGAGARFRVYQYLSALQAHGFEVTVQPFLTPELFQIIYQAGANLRKFSLLMNRTWARWKLLLRRTHYDLFFIYREAFPIGPPLMEMLLAKTKGRALIYDFDDAIFLPNHGGTHQWVGFLKYPQKVSQILRMSTQVITGNEYLADYARGYNKRVNVIPTSIDTTKFVPLPRPNPNGPTLPLVGWIGSHSTARYLQSLLPVLARVATTHPFRLYVVGSATPVRAAGLEVLQVPWALSREVEDFQRCDVGVYPLWDDDWCRGKCGFKAIQFMACGVPVVASAVGVNQEIIRDGVNGFLARTQEEWVEKFRRLLTDPPLRKRMGEAGRQTIEERYSVAVCARRVVDTFWQAVGHV